MHFFLNGVHPIAPDYPVNLWYHKQDVLLQGSTSHDMTQSDVCFHAHHPTLPVPALTAHTTFLSLVIKYFKNRYFFFL